MKKNCMSVLLVTGLLIFSNPVFAQKTYTPAQLRGMIKQEKYPKQGDVTTKSWAVDYVECIKVLERMVASVSPNYPTQTVLSLNIVRIEKVWTNDAAITVTCSAPDKNIVITSAPYI